MFQFIKKAGRKKDIVKSLSLNIDHSDVIDAPSKATDEEFLLAIEQEILSDDNQGHINDLHHSTQNILRIVNDANCLCYFVQYLDQESALPLIRFWLDVESFKSSTQPYVRQRTGEPKPVLGRSVSFDAAHLLADRGDESMATYRDDSHFDDLGLADDAAPANGLPLPLERDMGDGSSDAASMTNLSDVCERDAADDLSLDGHVYEQGRKSATGASSHGDDTDTMAEPTPFAVTGPAQPPTPTTAAAPTSTIVDAIRIFRKYLLNGELASLVRMPTDILSRISLALCVQLETGPMQANGGTAFDLSGPGEAIPFAQLRQTNVASVFDGAQAFVLSHLDAAYTAGFLDSAFFQRFCAENDGEHLQILDILHNEMALFYFMEFVETEGRRRYVDFWLGAMNFKRQLDAAMAPPADAPPPALSIEMSQKDALILYDKYFSLQATQPLLLSDQVRYHVEEKICSIDSAASVAHCFDLPLLIVERFLDQRYLPAFRMRSHLFGKYMSEVARKLDAAKVKTATATAAGRADAGPDQRPRGSISSKNTLLAMESVKKRHARQRIHAAPTSDMCIDSRQLHDPDLLWRRSASGLSFGRINAFGRYERNYDMTPFDGVGASTGTNGAASAAGTPAGAADSLDTIIHNTSNKIKRAVRKLVHLPEQSMQEELAWQMAEMIIKDVTSVTLPPGELAPANAIH